jgi:hypothetical protein
MGVNVEGIVPIDGIEDPALCGSEDPAIDARGGGGE